MLYDSQSNQLIGLVLPLDDKNGMPKLWTFNANSAEEIKQCMERAQSSLVYIVVVQALKENVPPFILQIFGTDNKFRAQDVLQLWAHTEKELKKCVDLNKYEYL